MEGWGEGWGAWYHEWFIISLSSLFFKQNASIIIVAGKVENKAKSSTCDLPNIAKALIHAWLSCKGSSARETYTYYLLHVALPVPSQELYACSW